MKIPTLRFFALFFSLGLLAHASDEDDVYQPPDVFLSETFTTGPDSADAVPPPSLLWLTKDMRPHIKSILGHSYPAMRIRYWRVDNRTAWILEEIGKVKPITVGFVVNNDQLERVKVLVYRESHGWEVKHPFFTDQFVGVALDADQELTQPIDGIAGATLSVNALTKLGRLALLFHQQVIAASSHNSQS